MASKKKTTPIEVEIPENIIHSAMDELMGERFGIYAKDVIQDRAIPEARDGMKPVQRRIIYAMYKTGNTIEKPTKKCAHIVGEVMGKYHPHGDSSIYEALVHMSQTWKIRYPLIDFQGNNGSMDGDGPAAYRYTEARLSALSEELIRDIDKETVDMELTFDDVEFEPSVLPARFPNLYVNGSQGIAVGMATEIPPHNLREISSAIIYRLKHPNCDIDKLIEFVPGPDFPTGGIIYKGKGLESIYRTGRGKIEISSKVEIVDGENGKQIIVSEIPYGITKSVLVGEIDRIRHDRIIPGIEEVRDETDKNGLRIAIDIKDESNPTAILTYLLGKTTLRTSYSANIVAIVDGKPKTLDLLTYCDTYINHQIDVVTRSSNFDLKKDKERLLIVEGLLKAASIINEIIAVIRRSKDKADSKINLEKAFGFLPEQSEAIVMMPLHKLSNTDVVTLENEKDALDKEIEWLEKVLSDRDTLLSLIEKDLKNVVKKYGNDRRSQIVEDDGSLRVVNKVDLIEDEDVYVVATRDGYLKRSSISSFKGSGGSRGVNAGMKNGDTMVYQGLANTKDTMLFFTNKGNYLFVPVHLIKVNKWLEEGIHVNYAITLPPEEKIIRGFAIKNFRDDLFIVILTKHGQIKRTRLSDFPVSRINRPIKAMKIIESDEIVDVRLSSGGNNLLVLSEDGKGVYYNENELPVASTSSSGVKAGKFHGSDCAKLLSFYPEEKGKILLLTQFGHTRIFDISKIELGNRLSACKDIFRSFKQEPHVLVYMEKALDKEFPYSVKTTLSNGDYFDITFSDNYLTPIERYAKKPEELTGLTKKNPIAFVNQFAGELVDEKITSLPVVERIKEEAPSEVIAEETKKEDKFEQINLFDDIGE